MSINTIMLHIEHSHSHSGFDLGSIITDTLIDGVKILPLLFLAYLIIEIIEHKASHKLRRALSDKRAGVLGGALLGLFPECGFSVAASNLYAEHLISAGALVAVFISTSDEALPILLSMPETAGYFLPLILIKLFCALIAGYLLDGIMRIVKRRGDIHEHESHHHAHGEHVHEAGEHHHCSFCDSNRGILQSSLKRTLMTALFILATIFVFNSIVAFVGEETIENIMSSAKFLQPFITALLGLIPSCAVSVMLVGLFAEGAISFGALAAGLCAGAGAGIAVLVKSCKDIRKSLLIIGYVWLFSSLAGVVISLFV